MRAEAPGKQAGVQEIRTPRREQSRREAQRGGGEPRPSAAGFE